MATSSHSLERTYRVALSFDIAAAGGLRPYYGHRGEFAGFVAADGSIYRPILTMERQAPNDGDHDILTLRQCVDVGIEVHDQRADQFEETTEPEFARDPEVELRALWRRQGIPKERQDELIADATATAQVGAMVGPFRIAARAPKSRS